MLVAQWYRAAVLGGMFAVLAAPSAMAVTHEVVVGAGVFTPEDLTVVSGDTIHWTWEHPSHSVTSGAPCTPDGRFDSGVLGMGAEFSYTVPGNEPAGVIDYFCTPHCGIGMTGTITVLGPAIPTTSEWGLAVMMLLVLAAGTVVFSLHRRAGRCMA